MKKIAFGLTLSFSILAMGSQALASSFGFLPARTSEEAQVKDLLEKGQYTDAFSQWESAYSNDPAFNSSNLQGTFAFLLLENGAELSALEKLSQIQGAKLPVELRNLIFSATGVNLSVWRLPGVTYKNQFKGLISEKVKLAIAAWQISEIASSSDFKKVQNLLAQLDKASDPAQWLKWQMALYKGGQNRVTEAIDLLQSLLDSNQNAVGDDQIIMAAARLMYQSGKLDGAMKYYSMILASSDYWLEAIEEKGWTFAKADNFERTLGQTKTLLTPVFSPQVGPEPYFLTALSDLRLCDYAGVFKTLKDFKARQQVRVDELQSLVKLGKTPASTQAISKMLGGVKSWNDLGADAQRVPRMITRDDVLGKFIEKEHKARNEIEILKRFPEQTGLKVALDRQSREFENQISSRVVDLAKIDLAEISKIVVKLQIAEAESIHRMSAGQNIKVKHTVEAKNSNTITFPYEDEEVWTDEVDHYRLSAKGCPVHGGQNL